MEKTVVVGMSGGVDSSVCAYLLKKQGFNVIGVTMQIWQEEDSCTIEREGGCCGQSAVDDARRVASAIGIPYYVINFRDEFKKNVIDYFVDEYLQGRTPNPCNACNRFVKWESLLQKSLEIGADYIATGHYARIEKLENGRYAIKNSVTAKKDQTYALYNLTQFQLEHTLMPIGEYEKSQVREIAKEAGLPVAGKPDSQDICFVPDGDYGKFIERETKRTVKPGEFVDKDGNVLGIHKGIIHYTIGQRKGLNLSMGHPVFVTGIDAENNRVIVGESEDLFTTTVVARDFNFMGVSCLDEEETYVGKIRYAHKGTLCRAKYIGDGKVLCEFNEPVRAVTPGQALVLYKGDYVAGGGIIC